MIKGYSQIYGKISVLLVERSNLQENFSLYFYILIILPNPLELYCIIIFLSPLEIFLKLLKMFGKATLKWCTVILNIFKAKYHCSHYKKSQNFWEFLFSNLCEIGVILNVYEQIRVYIWNISVFTKFADESIGQFLFVSQAGLWYVN